MMRTIVAGLLVLGLCARASAQETPRGPDVEARVSVLHDGAVHHAPRSYASRVSLRLGDTKQAGAAPTSSATLGPPMEAIMLALIGGSLAVVGAIVLGAGEVDRTIVQFPAVGSTWAQIANAYQAGPVLEVAGAISLGVGVVSCVVGLVWAASSPGTPTRTALRIGPTSMELRVTF